MSRVYVQYHGEQVPVIAGAGGGKGGGKTSPNSLFSTDILLLTNAFGEGPIYRINPNGPQDIEIQDSTIDDLINIDGDGQENHDKFKTAIAYGTTTQDPLPLFGDAIITPQLFGSSVTLKKGNLAGVPSSSVTLQETSANDWDSIKFNFVISQLQVSDDKGNVKPYSVGIQVKIYDRLGSTLIDTIDRTISGKTDTAYKLSLQYNIPEEYKSVDGYRFTVTKTSNDSSDSKVQDAISLIGWDEIKNVKQAYPRTALIGYAIKATDEHTGGIPDFTSLLKGLIIKVPSNYNQPILSNGEIDWRELETGEASYTTYGYRLQNSGSTLLTESTPQIYVGTWDGSFVYSWTQNPVWIVYDILVNRLGIAEQNIDKYKFYQIAQYCDACDSSTGRFIGVSGIADGSFRYKPQGLYTAVRETLVGLPKGTVIQERRFLLDVSISEQEQAMDILNKITATFRAILVYAGGKVSLAVDMPDDYPAMLFTEATIKQGSIQLSGNKQSEVFTGVDVSYIEPTNHFKREVIRIDSADANDGTDTSEIENVASLDLFGVTRRSQAIRMAQYQLAASKYLRRSITFSTGTDAINLAPGDLISVALQSTGVSYGYGGKVAENSIAASTDTNVHLEHFTVPSLSNTTFMANNYPLALRILKPDSDRLDLYLISNTNYTLSTSGNITSGHDYAKVNIISRFDPISKTIVPVTTLTANLAPEKGDLWSLGEFPNPNNYYTNKSGRLFKITGLKRDSKDDTIEVSALEYVSNVYTDSDTFINYEPTAYVDIVSPFTTPPAPTFTFSTRLRTKLDGTVVVDGVLDDKSEFIGYGQNFITEYYQATPDKLLPIANVVSSSPFTVVVSNTINIANGTLGTGIVGKNGFTTPIGVIPLLCNAIAEIDSNIVLTIEGLSSCIDDNFGGHVLASNDSEVFGPLKGLDQVLIPVIEKSNSGGLINFIGYNPMITKISRTINDYNVAIQTLTIENTITDGIPLADLLDTPPFYVSISQLLEPTYYTANCFYVTGSTLLNIEQGNLASSSTVYIDLTNKPRVAKDVKLFIDGVQKNYTAFTVNKNTNLPIKANIAYTKSVNDTHYRIEHSYYTVPAIEAGDVLQINYGNTLVVSNTSYDSASSQYNSATTSNSLYKIYTTKVPNFSLNSYNFINLSPDIIGSISNITSNTVTISYNANTYIGNFRLANSGIYSLATTTAFEKIFLTDSLIIPELPIGSTIVKARNRNVLGRLSPFIQKMVTIESIPIQKVTGLTLIESLYREQTGGVAVRVTCEFDHIEGQEVTDYEISYKLSEVTNIGANDAGSGLTSYNTVKVPASGVDTDNKIRFTINGINRGASSESNYISVRVTPMNRGIRGLTATTSSAIVGKTATPQNIYNFTGGQQADVLTLLWSYVRVNDELADLDLKEVIIRRLPGEVTINIDNFVVASPFLTVSAGSVRKSAPIDTFGTYTYLARTRDTSGNFSEDVVGVTLTTSKPQRSTIVSAYSEDYPGSNTFTIADTNYSEYYFPSFSNSNTEGIAYSYTSSVDNANGSSYGFSFDPITPTDLLADGYAEYITQIRDFGATVTGGISLNIQVTQSVQLTYTDLYTTELSGVSEPSSSNTFTEVDFTGIGNYLGFANITAANGRYDANNKTWMTGTAAGNVWAILNPGQFVGDTSNANSFAFIAGLINANSIALGETFYANGDSTSSNIFANASSGISYKLINLTQYSDTGSTFTYAGDLGVVSTQTYIRTSTTDPYYANGNVNVAAFSGGTVNNGYVPYEAGSKTFRYFQVKLVINNSRPEEFDAVLEDFKYNIDKEQTIFTDTVTYSTSPTNADFTASNFIFRPAIAYTLLDYIDSEANSMIVVTSQASNQGVSFKLFASDGTGEYTANSTANIMITAIGV